MDPECGVRRSQCATRLHRQSWTARARVPLRTAARAAPPGRKAAVLNKKKVFRVRQRKQTLQMMTTRSVLDTRQGEPGVDQCKIWDSIGQLRAKLFGAIESYRSFRHPHVIEASVRLDEHLNLCRRCSHFPCSLVKEQQSM
ncbi:MAG: hypothetical protein CW345_07890 [Firmicutes bacterium]|nr:hypothetical protein [Bacillota bacterium]MBO2521708.1 hypothetical protein [Bacillota bacterium]